MNPFAHYRDAVVAVVDALAKTGALPAGLETARIAVEPPRDPAHGDFATNAAMVLAKAAGKPPRALAEALLPGLRALPHVTGADIAGPGFVNLRVAPEFWRARLADILAAGERYGDSAMGAGAKVNVEYVSANPTGLMHVGHARGAVFGDALASLLDKAGFAVTREYYINDAGNQIEILTESVLKRMRQLNGETVPDTEFAGLYPGEEVIAAAKRLRADGVAPADRARIRDGAVAFMMERIREDLAALGVRHDVFVSERALVEAGAVEAAQRALTEQGLIYVGTLEPPKGKLPEDWEPRPQTLFKSSAFGDEVDRPLKKSDGSWTYFASDIAYHHDKFRRGFRALIDVWGADHGGYIKRLQAAVTAITGGQAALDVKLCQLVNLFDRGQPVKMSKRAGTVVTAREVVDEVGKDVVRFMMLTRKNDAALDFDYAKVKEQSKDNPVFYVQYAHARCRSVFRQAAETMPDLDVFDANLAKSALERLTDSGEMRLIKTLAAWPRAIEGAAEAHEPHRIAFYLADLAADFHGHWNRGKEDAQLRFVREDDRGLTLARLALVRAVGHVIASGLRIFGVEPVEEMR